jgi:hypothetical protein
MQRTANPRTPVQFRPRPPDFRRNFGTKPAIYGRFFVCCPVLPDGDASAFHSGAAEAGYPHARMAKLVDASDLKSAGREAMPVRFRLRAPQQSPTESSHVPKALEIP